MIASSARRMAISFVIRFVSDARIMALQMQPAKFGRLRTYLYYIVWGAKPVDEGRNYLSARRQPLLILPVPNPRPLRHPRSVGLELPPRSSTGKLFVHSLRLP